MNDLRGGMSIRDQYIPAFEDIRKRYGEEPSGWKVDPDISLEQAIGYTGEYIIGEKQNHFRYNRYERVLNQAMRGPYYSLTNRTMLCMDMGCGPGLFSWVVQDYMSPRLVNNGSIEMIGYDYAKNMIKLSKIFNACLNQRLATKYDWRGYFKIDHLECDLKNRDFSEHDIIVTLGHVLIQVSGDTQAMREFSKVIQILQPVKSCIVIAVDAYSNDRPQEFRDGWEGFREALSEDGMDCQSVYLNTDRNSYAYARLVWREQDHDRHSR